MKLPIKLNCAGWPAMCSSLSFAFDDPRLLARELSSLSPAEFTAAISVLQFGETFKTTRPNRHRQSNELIRTIYRGSTPVILDVGASDGTTSLDLIVGLNRDFSNYFVTDLNLWVSCSVGRHGVVYFKDRNGTCILRASKRWLVYSNTTGALPLLRLIARRLLAGYRDGVRWRDILLIQPELVRLAASDPRIVIAPYDMFSPWTGRRPDLIKIACLLNSRYFSADSMVRSLRMQCSNLSPGGRLLLVSEDIDVERFSLFRKTSNGMQLEHEHEGGAKAAGYVSPKVDDFVLSQAS
ncbi:MAG: hypothetical protein IVW54_08040 [Candidatus Binataceae bacterium]|nr:hypothetical protein [Candidatus Binataceae bacterium]